MSRLVAVAAVEEEVEVAAVEEEVEEEVEVAAVEVVAVDHPHRRQEHLRCRCLLAVGPMMSPCDF